MQSDTEVREQREREEPSARGARWQRVRAQIPAIAVVVVAITAMGTAIVVMHTDAERGAPSMPAVRSADRPANAARKQGAGPACHDCGVVVSVVTLEPQAQASPVAYQMRIRMDDGSVRTVEQLGPLATGSRVMLAGGSAHPVGGRAVPG
jgi:hypothetical protein